MITACIICALYACLQKQKKKCVSLAALKRAAEGGQAGMLVETEPADAMTRSDRAESIEMDSITAGSEPQ